MADGLLDTSVIVDWDDPVVLAGLPDGVALSSISLAELAAGPHLAREPLEKARRQARLQQVESLFDPLDFDAGAARSFGQVVAAVVAAGRSHRSRWPKCLRCALLHDAVSAASMRRRGLDGVRDRLSLRVDQLLQLHVRQ